MTLVSDLLQESEEQEIPFLSAREQTSDEDISDLIGSALNRSILEKDSLDGILTMTSPTQETPEGASSTQESSNSSGKQSANARSTKTRMPPAYAGKHPRYDSSDPASVVRFFEGVEMAAKEAGLQNDDKEIMSYALGYLDQSTRRKWDQLPGASSPFSFSKWKTAVLKILPRTARLDKGSLERLDELCRSLATRPLGRDERAPYFDFMLEFQAEARPLLAAKPPVVSNFDLVVRFLNCLRPSFKEVLRDKLVQEENRSEDDPFSIEEVIRVATALVDASSVGPFGEATGGSEQADYNRMRDSKSASPSTSVDYKKLDSVAIKQESMEQDFARIFATLDTVSSGLKETNSRLESFATFVKETQSTAQSSRQAVYPPQPAPAVPGQRPGMYSRPPSFLFACFYCKDTAHTVAQCGVLRKDLADKKITQQGTAVYVHGRHIPRDSPDGLSMKERVDKAWASGNTANVNMMEFYQPSNEYYENFNQQQYEPEPVTFSVLQQTMDRMRQETHGAMANMATQIVNAVRPPVAAPTVPEPPREISNREIFETLRDLSKKVEGVEQFAIQTRSSAVQGQSQGF